MEPSPKILHIFYVFSGVSSFVARRIQPLYEARSQETLSPGTSFSLTSSRGVQSQGIAFSPLGRSPSVHGCQTFVAMVSSGWPRPRILDARMIAKKRRPSTYRELGRDRFMKILGRSTCRRVHSNRGTPEAGFKLYEGTPPHAVTCRMP